MHVMIGRHDAFVQHVLFPLICNALLFQMQHATAMLLIVYMALTQLPASSLGFIKQMICKSQAA